MNNVARGAMESRFEEKLENTIHVTNRTRKILGLMPVVIRMRDCLRCDKQFKSIGFANRTCGCSRHAGI